MKILIENSKNHKVTMFGYFLLASIFMFTYFFLVSYSFPPFVDDLWLLSKHDSLKNTMSHLIMRNNVSSLHLIVLGSMISTTFPDIILSLSNTTLVNLIFYYAFNRLPIINNTKNPLTDAVFLLFIFLMFCYISPQILELIAWSSGGHHNISLLLGLVGFLPYYKMLFFNQLIMKNSYLIYIFSIIFYVLYGMIDPYIVALLIPIMCLSVLIYYIRNKKIPIAYIIFIVIALLSFVFLVLPSYMNRATDEASTLRSLLQVFKTFIYLTFKKSIFSAVNLFNVFKYISYIIMVIFLFDYILLKRLKNYYHYLLILIFTAFILYFSILILSISPYLSFRNLSVQYFLIILFFILLLKPLFYNNVLNKNILMMIFLIVNMAMIPNLFKLYSVTNQYGIYYKLLSEYESQYKVTGSILYKDIMPSDNIFNDKSPNFQEWFNKQTLTTDIRKKQTNDFLDWFKEKKLEGIK